MRKKRVRKERQHGVPPPPTFSLAALSDDTLLRQVEVAAVKRESVTYTEKKRYAGTDGLDWKYIGGWPRCTVGSLKKVMQSDPTKRLRSPRSRIRRNQTRHEKNNGPDVLQHVRAIFVIAAAQRAGLRE
jgi:hypothetical protein